VVQYFNSQSTRGERARQIYQILIGYAMRRQLITYGELANLMGMDGVGVQLAPRLHCILDWCKDNGLPPLTAVVINQDDGLPSSGIEIKAADLPRTQAEVFKFDWYAIHAPHADELSPDECEEDAAAT
jgi:putative restriction endonuclease